MKTRIKELREEYNLTQKELSLETGIDQRTISNYENEKTVPDAYALISLSNCFNVTIDYILYRSDNCDFDDSVVKRYQKRDGLAVEIKDLIDKLSKM